MYTITTSFVCLLVLGGLFGSVRTESYNYDQHGADWPEPCTGQDARKQSPINLPRDPALTKNSYLFADFRPIQANVTISDTTVLIVPSQEQARFGQFYTQTIGENHFSFRAAEIRIRCNSQHRIQQPNSQTFKQYDLEIQIQTFPLIGNQNDKVFIGLLFQAKQSFQDDPFLAQIVKGSEGKQKDQTYSIQADLSHLLSRDQIFNFWFYTGSVTYPPCKSTKINWLIPDKIFPMSQTQLNFFKQYYPNGNWREIQPVKGNQVGYASVLPQKNQEL